MIMKKRRKGMAKVNLKGSMKKGKKVLVLLGQAVVKALVNDIVDKFVYIGIMNKKI